MVKKLHGKVTRRGSLSAQPFVPLTFTFFTIFLAIVWTSQGLAATLTWNANTEVDLAGYHVYRCTQQPCGGGSGTASLLATLGKVTSFDIGTPTAVQFYVVTAYDFANHESSDSAVAIFTPATPTPPPPPSTSPPAPTNLHLSFVQ